ncbi:hypothetical protein [Maridesulfovibrio sp.]|uniref:hypothetical protein n=1 Tax=Maridesulfovibrio sp. TaxID=2795000 RepID=UPI0029C9C474|nr:hypothetical protein [Maridesulfovibrio sp.]
MKRKTHDFSWVEWFESGYFVKLGAPGDPAACASLWEFQEVPTNLFCSELRTFSSAGSVIARTLPAGSECFYVGRRIDEPAASGHEYAG